MKNQSKQFLGFNGTNINVLAVDGTIYVAIKPICTALGVDYISQFKSIQDDKMLSELLSEQTMVAQDNKLRKMTCLPEMYIYGWLFSINSKSESLLAYKRECYDVLFNHFHGTTTERVQILRTKSQKEIDLGLAKDKLNELIRNSEEFAEVQKLSTEVKEQGKSMTENDKKLLEGQFKLFGN